MGRRLGYAVAAGSLVVVAACSNGAEAPTSSTRPTTTYEQPDVGAPSGSVEAPLPAATGNTEDNCNSIRAVRPGAYFNESYRDNIDDQLDTMRVAFSPNANADIDSDFLPWLAMSHAMEDDPEYADAMTRAYATISANPDNPLSSTDILRMNVPPPELCAPQRLTDAASRKQLQETRQVSGAVAKGLLNHLGEQGSRAARSAYEYLLQQWQKFDQALERQLQSS